MEKDRDDVFARAREALRRQAPGAAADLLRPWVETHPQDAGGWGLLGAAYFELADWAHAEAAVRNLVRLRPSSAKAWCNMGTILRKLGRFAEAEEALRKALACDKSHARSRRELAKLPRSGPAVTPSDSCPTCGAAVFPSDHRCMECGGNLQQLRLAAQREAAERAQREAAKRQAEAAAREAEAAREAAIRFVVDEQARGAPDEQTAASLAAQGWERDLILEFLGLPGETPLLVLPDGACSLITDANAAKHLQARARIIIKEYRVRKRAVNAEIKEVRQLYKTTAPGPMGRRASYGRGGLASFARAIDEAGRIAHQEQVAQHAQEKDEAIQRLEEEKLAIDSAILAWEKLIAGLEEWVGRNS